MGEFGDLFVKFSIIGLFVFSIFSFVYMAQDSNDVESTILEDTVINKTFNTLSDNLTDYRGNAQNQKGGFEKEFPSTGFGSLLLFSIVSGGIVFTSMITGIYNAIIVLPASILGISPIVISVFTGIFVIIIILSLWRLYKLGG